MSKLGRDFIYVKTHLNIEKFQLDWPANNRIIAESLFSHFSGFLFSDSVSKCWEIQQWMPRQPSFYI